MRDDEPGKWLSGGTAGWETMGQPATVPPSQPRKVIETATWGKGRQWRVETELAFCM